ncbi:MAG: pyridoxamine 5'-phosphate oxidase family protein [Myxococcota bacterium]|nr:pyridoxamine 5'-phosphate oxidase family protein [Myxococcota bacterium]
MIDIRRKEKAITSHAEMNAILKNARHVTLAMCDDNEPYLVTLSHGYDVIKNCIYFHCAGEGKKIDILRKNPVVWGQALEDRGYVQGECDHLYATTQFRGKVRFLEEIQEKRRGLEVMIEALEDNPDAVKAKQLTEKSVHRVTIGRIDIDYMTGKKSSDV